MIGRFDHSLLLAQVQAAPAATLANYCAAWADASDGKVSVATMGRALQHLG